MITFLIRILVAIEITCTSFCESIGRKRSFCSFCSSFISLIVLGTRPFLLPPFLFFCALRSPCLLLLPERERVCRRQGPQVGVANDVALFDALELVE